MPNDRATGGFDLPDDSTIRTIHARPLEEVRACQLFAAAAIIGDATLTSSAEREGALREVLEALGIYKVDARVVRATAHEHGTLRGYDAHIRNYQTPCDTCLAARTAELDERWERMGIDIDEGTEVVMPV